MITASTPTRQRSPSRWQADMASAITYPLELVTELGLDPALVAPAEAAGTAFRLRVPRSYVSRMRRGDVNDPLLRQILPLGAELADASDYTADPLGEHAALRAPGNDVFLNDVAIGPDGAAYFTNSNDPQVFRVADDGSGWRASLWADATDTIDRKDGFNLGGIVLTADRSAFVVAQGNVGRLWRFSTRTATVGPVETGGADLKDADGLVRQGNRLTVVRNFSKMIATLRLTHDGRRALLLDQQASAADRVLTTAKTLRGRILYVDSKFDEAVASPPYEVITDPTR